MKYFLCLITLIFNHIFEFIRFVRYSNLFSYDTSEKLRGKIVFLYHSIEKGLINEPLRLKFGSAKIERLLFYLHLWVSKGYCLNDSQFLSACSVLMSYYELHQKHNLNIDDIISEENYSFLMRYSGKVKGGYIQLERNEYFAYSNSSFKEFSKSRHSVRHFSGEKVNNQLILDVIELARYAPSVCNRQGFRVKLVNNTKLVQKILKIQSGLNSTANLINQLLIVSVERGIFVSSGEWSQVFIDGGIFLQNLLYSLHYYKIAAVPLNWSKNFYYDKKVEKLIKFPKSEKIISIVAIGYPQNIFKVTQSSRKSVNEILKIIE